MKNFNLISFLIIIAASLLFVQCTTDPIPGPAGADGMDGVDGVDGVNGTTECAVCHNVSTSEAVHASYLFSGHAAGAAAGYAGGRASCARCHSNEGFIEYTTYGQVAANIDNPTPISCTTCHDMHKTFDFANEGYDYALRTVAPVELIQPAGYELDLANGLQRTANLCINCHQARSSGPVDNGMGLYEQTSTHWGPHHGPQANLIEGLLGIELAGSLDYPAPGEAGHKGNGACINCHMAENDGNINGNHTWIKSTTNCTVCHQNGIPEEVAGLAEDMEALLHLLEEEGILHGEINDDNELEVHPLTGTFPILTAEAAWNYLYIYEDMSHGTHNPKYAKALIRNSLEALSAAD